jgi:hypothetical protein
VVRLADAVAVHEDELAIGRNLEAGDLRQLLRRLNPLMSAAKYGPDEFAGRP